MLAKPLFGTIGNVPAKDKNKVTNVNLVKEEGESENDYVERVKENRRNPFTTIDYVLIGLLQL